MDAAPPAPPAIVLPAPSPASAPSPEPYVPAATDLRPRGDREVSLCEKASHPDWLYLGGILLGDAAAVLVDMNTKDVGVDEPRDQRSGTSRAVRYVGPFTVGLAWGFTLGGGYLALPKCSMDFVRSAPPEGNVRSPWPFAIAVAMLSGATAPLFLGTIEQGGTQVAAVGERSMRFVLAGGMGVVGALLPYVLSPRTWSGARELAHIRAESTPDMKGAFVSYSARF